MALRFQEIIIGTTEKTRDIKKLEKQRQTEEKLHPGL
jgi:hypothetical protein